MNEKPRRGDLVKLIGNHPYAGCIGVYKTDRAFYSEGELYPVVKLKHLGEDVEVVVLDPENQMRKM